MCTKNNAKYIRINDAHDWSRIIISKIDSRNVEYIRNTCELRKIIFYNQDPEIIRSVYFIVYKGDRDYYENVARELIMHSYTSCAEMIMKVC